MKKSLLVLLISVCAALLSAQSAATKVPYISLEYYDSPSQIQITDLKGFTEQTLYFGMKLDPGYKIKTLKSSAELKLFPNGSIIKLAPNTEIALSSLQGLNEATSTDIDVVGGKIRMVASKLGKPSYKLKTPTAVAGVRGTDFGIEVISGKAEKLLVREGSVEFSKADGSGTSLVNTGMGLDAFASTFAATALSLEELGSFFAELDFSTLNPLEVPASDTAQDVASVDAAKDNAVVVEEKPATLVEETVKPQAVDAVAIPVVEDVKADDSKPQTEKPEDKADAETPAWQKLLAKYLGLELGSITLDGRTYGKAVMQPKFETDSFKLALYLPVIYKDNILDPSDWYRPAGNDEWSFGTDQGGDWLLIAGDAAQDLMLKLKFLQIGSEGSPFFMKVANIPSMTLGHGLFINQYANDADFPAIRRIGLNIGTDSGKSALEFLVNDLANPDLLGLRYVIRPAPQVMKAGLGVSLALDINPSGSLPDTGIPASLQSVKDLNPIIAMLGLDLDLPFLKTGLVDITAFADFGTVLPWLRGSNADLTEGIQLQSAFSLNPVSFNNYGIQAGLAGKVLIVDYRLAFEMTNGAFELGMVDRAYDRTRAEKASRLLESLVNVETNTAFANPTMGIVGKAGSSLFGLADLSLSYGWPWASEGGTISTAASDSFGLDFKTKKDILPYGIQAGLAYERTNFVKMFTEPTVYTWLDEYATLKGEGKLPIGDFFSIKASLGTAVKRDASGNILFDLTGAPTMYPVFTLETVIGQ